MRKQTALICTSVILSCAVMAVVDGILQPGYIIKSAVKIILFLVIPIACSADRSMSVARCLCPDRKAIFTGLCLGAATLLLITTAYALLHPYLDLSTVPTALEQGAGVTKDNFLFVGTYIALCNSLLEEFFFRGFAFLALSKVAPKAFACFFSAGAFAVYHAGMLAGMLSPLLFVLALIALTGCGLLFNFLNSRSERIWTSWLIHIGANFAINLIGMRLLGMIK